MKIEKDITAINVESDMTSTDTCDNVCRGHQNRESLCLSVKIKCR